MDKYLATDTENIDKCLKKKPQVEDSTNYATINKQENRVKIKLLILS